MPPITLDAQARAMLEDYYWRGNIRQLKNVAEQISAIEESRTITAEVLRRYLPEDGSQTTVPVLVGNGSQPHASGDFERELLYKMLFDMRSEISEIKSMLHEILAGRSTPEQAERIAGFLQAAHVIPAPQEQVPAPGYAESEEVTEPERELTKEEVLRNAIVKALRKHNGRRKEAAKELFISERTLYRKIKELGINEY